MLRSKCAPRARTGKSPNFGIEHSGSGLYLAPLLLNPSLASSRSAHRLTSNSSILGRSSLARYRIAIRLAISPTGSVWETGLSKYGVDISAIRVAVIPAKYLMTSSLAASCPKLLHFSNWSVHRSRDISGVGIAR